MKDDLELYIHIPFCVKKCNYCDFLSFPGTGAIQREYVEKLKSELIYRSSLCGSHNISSVFVGGGTPSILQSGLVESVIETVFKYYRVQKDAEITVECNPSSAMRHKFGGYKTAGVNRLSFGLQSADNRELRLLGRTHSFEEFLKSYESARREGFDNINVDLMNHFPTETALSWKKTLKNVVMLKPEHISVYALIIEEGTPFHNLIGKNLLIMPEEEEDTAIDEYTSECTAKYGYERYEFSNYARPGRECRHNIGYWTGAEYLGFGLGASSYFDGIRWKNISELSIYLQIDFDGADGADDILRQEVERLTRQSRMEEFIYLGMRLTKGISRAEFKREFGSRIENVFGKPLDKYLRLGLIELTEDRYRLTGRGIDVSNVVLSDFLLH